MPVTRGYTLTLHPALPSPASTSSRTITSCDQSHVSRARSVAKYPLVHGAPRQHKRVWSGWRCERGKAQHFAMEQGWVKIGLRGGGGGSFEPLSWTPVPTPLPGSHEGNPQRSDGVGLGGGGGPEVPQHL